MVDFLARLGGAALPILTSITTVAVLTVLRLLAPSVRWRRRLKQDTDVLGPLPPGDEKERRAASVEAQAMRLRLYYESNTRTDRAIEWLTLVVFLNVGLLFLFDIRLGEGVQVQLTGVDWPIVAFSALVCGYVTMQLIRGFPVVPRRGAKAEEYLVIRRAFREHHDRVFAARAAAAAADPPTV